MELWLFRQGKLLRSLSCGGSCRLLAADPPLSAEPSLHQHCAWARDCLLLDLDAGSVTAVGTAFCEQISIERERVHLPGPLNASFAAHRRLRCSGGRVAADDYVSLQRTLSHAACEHLLRTACESQRTSTVYLTLCM